VKQVEGGGKYLLAEPEKALLDYFYFHLGKIEGSDDIEELRMNYHEIQEKIDRKKFLAYRSQFRIEKLNRVTDRILEFIV
jgi:hypothetical protein